MGIFINKVHRDKPPEYLLTVLVYMIAACIAVLSLSPLLASGYYSDDMASSLLKARLTYDGGTLYMYILGHITELIHSLGRFQPVAAVFSLPVIYLSQNVVLYKIIILSLIIVNIWLFGYLIQVYFRNLHLAAFSMATIPIFFQFRLFHDPILSFGGGPQIMFAFFLLSLIFLNNYLTNRKTPSLVASVIFYNLCLYYYELWVPLGIVYFLIIYFRTDTFKNALRTISPYFVSIAVALGVNMAVRILFRDDTATAYSGTSINIHLEPVLHTLKYQIFAAQPLGYYFADPSQLFRQTFKYGDKIAVLAGFCTALLTFSAVCWSLWNLKKRASTAAASLMFMVGALLLVLPALMVSISQKYQQEFDWYGGLGIGYIPVYFEYFGVLLLLVCVITLLRKFVPDAGQRVLAIVIGIVVSVVSYVNLDNNRVVVEKSNLDLYYRRLTLERALEDGILNKVPENAVVLIQDNYTYDPYSSNVITLKGWLNAYDWKNKYLVYFYSKKKMTVVNNVEQLLGNGAVLDDDPSSLTDARRVVRPGYYVLQIESCSEYAKDFKPKEGYVSLYSISEIDLNQQNINDSKLHMNPLETYAPQDYLTSSLNEAIERDDSCKSILGEVTE